MALVALVLAAAVVPAAACPWAGKDAARAGATTVPSGLAGTTGRQIRSKLNAQLLRSKQATAFVARDESAIKYKYLPNVLTDTHDHSFY